jgi:hypothetical protein
MDANVTSELLWVLATSSYVPKPKILYQAIAGLSLLVSDGTNTNKKTQGEPRVTDCRI